MTTYKLTVPAPGPQVEYTQEGRNIQDAAERLCVKYPGLKRVYFAVWYMGETIPAEYVHCDALEHGAFLGWAFVR